MFCPGVGLLLSLHLSFLLTRSLLLLPSLFPFLSIGPIGGPLHNQSGPLPQPAVLQRRLSAGAEFRPRRGREEAVRGSLPRPEQPVHGGRPQKPLSRAPVTPERNKTGRSLGVFLTRPDPSSQNLLTSDLPNKPRQRRNQAFSPTAGLLVAKSTISWL